MKTDELRKNWEMLMISISASPASESAYHWLEQAYQEHGRFYHSLPHIRDLLFQWKRDQELLRQPIAVALALWFHDSVYDPRRSDNEAESARMAQEWLAKVQASPSMVAQVSHLIMLTDGHQPVHDTFDEGWLLDADLSILGREPSRYLQYAEEIRQEYHFIPWPDYRSGRRAVLQRFLERPQLYFTDAYQSRYEAQARENLQREWEALDREEE